MDIEKDIKRCEKLTKPQNANWIGISNQIAIGHVIERIKELEEKLEFKQWGDLDNLQFEEYMNSFIPKQRVKETIEKIKERMEKEDIKGNCYNVHAVIYLLERIERMLLEDK